MTLPMTHHDDHDLPDEHALLSPSERQAFMDDLDDAAVRRRRQLLALPALVDDLVVRAQREAALETLAEIDAARGRLATGHFGACTRCHGPIRRERLEARPWTGTCLSCAGR